MIKFHLKLLIIFTFNIFIIHTSFAQFIKSKDGVVLGKRSDFISSCINGAEKKLININGIEMETAKYCSCVCDNLIPTLNSWEITKAMKDNKLKDLFIRNDNLEIIMKCAESTIKYSDNFKFSESGDIDLQRKIWMKVCRNEIIKNNTDNIWNTELANEACSCVFNKLIADGYSYKEFQEMIDKNSTVFNEVAVPCVSKAFETKIGIDHSNSYNVNDIKGGTYRSEVKMIDYFGQGYKLKIKIGNVSKYFLFDTGASDLTIDRDTERELLIEGILKKDSYLNKSNFEMADNRVVTGQNVKVDNVTIGDYTVNNVVITIMNEGSLLCGKSFLDKFKNWEFDKNNNVLILYK